MQEKHIEDPDLCLTYKEAHLAEQTGAPRHESPRIITRRTCQPARGRWPGERHLGLADPQGRPNMDAFSAAQSLAGRLFLSPRRSWLTFPYRGMAGTDLSSYKRRPSPHSTHNKKRREELHSKAKPYLHSAYK
jgi:hypothetical protein